MILAVLERRARLALTKSDVYVSTVGGVKLTEPAADLAIALAIVSAAHDVPLRMRTVAFGELSLTGEVRRVSAGDQRRNEAKRLGYKNVLDASIGDLERVLAASRSGDATPSAVPDIRPVATTDPGRWPDRDQELSAEQREWREEMVARAERAGLI